VLYKKFVVAPKTADDAKQHTPEYEKAGLPGCIGSMDATHILLEKVEYRLRQSHVGFKSSHTARSYNITVNNRRRILATTTGHPARWNDKTVVLFDNFVVALNEGTTLQDVTFELYDVDACGSVFKQKYAGALLIVDNGYLNWSTTVPPMKTSTSRTNIRFSQWLESIRKDVKCTFGILKGRFRILKSGIRLVGQESADKIFLTCCALHNWLLNEDGLNKAWEDGVLSDWEGELGLHNVQDVEYHIPDAVQRLMTRGELRRYDVSGMGFRSNVRDGEQPPLPLPPSHQRGHSCTTDTSLVVADLTASGVRVVKDLSLDFFRSKLIRHYDIAFQRNEIQWPGKRNRQRQVNI
jgi:hypothetical protein